MPIESNFSVKTEVFEGPLDLLLELVNKRKLFINDVSLAQVSDDFIGYIREQESAGRRIPMGESAEFIVVASTLMLIKSHSLLPGIQLSQEEEESIEDLEHRLAMLAYFKELSSEIKDRFGKEIIFEKQPSKSRPIIFAPDKRTDIDNLSLAMSELLKSIPQVEVLPKAAVKKMVSLEETIESLSERITKAMRMNFKDLYTGGEMTPEKKVDIIVGFLAMLELVKRGLIRATQSGQEIEIERQSEIANPNF